MMKNATMTVIFEKRSTRNRTEHDVSSLEVLLEHHRCRSAIQPLLVYFAVFASNAISKKNTYVEMNFLKYFNFERIYERY